VAKGAPLSPKPHWFPTLLLPKPANALFREKEKSLEPGSQQTQLCVTLQEGLHGAALCLGDDEAGLRAEGNSDSQEEQSRGFVEPTIHTLHVYFPEVPQPLHISLPAASCTPRDRGGSRVRADAVFAG